MKLSDQAIGVLMMALQKSLLEQADIVPMLKELDFAQMDNNQLLVENPPDIKVRVPVPAQQSIPVEAQPDSVKVTMTETDNSIFAYGQGSNSDA